MCVCVCVCVCACACACVCVCVCVCAHVHVCMNGCIAGNVHYLNELLANMVEVFVTFEGYVISHNSCRGRGILDCDCQTEYGTQTLHL